MRELNLKRIALIILLTITIVIYHKIFIENNMFQSSVINRILAYLAVGITGAILYLILKKWETRNK
jgi:hypothetical protein